MRYLLPVFFAVALFACGNPIKDESSTVEVESGVDTTAPLPSPAPAAAPEDTEDDEITGFWVGSFEPAEDHDGDKNVYTEGEFMWDRTNKINLSIDEIRGDSVFGHSVVAGNDRPFTGTRKMLYGKYRYQVREPGDDRYDGQFEFTIEDDVLAGTWSAYKQIDISEREYALEKASFSYDPEVILDEASWYVDWTNSREEKQTIDYGDDYVEEWMAEEYATATEKIYEINASSQKLTKEQVENLKKGDLTIIRNTIYARHGYSFKNRPLRVFFDAQPWYIPVHADIRADFTELEKDNIQLLLKYEKNAAEYYDYFGRG